MIIPGALARITAATLRAIADELDPPAGSRDTNRRDYSGTDGLHTALSARILTRRPAVRQPPPDRLRPTGFGLPGLSGEEQSRTGDRS